jgi:hypothetical protein
LKTRADPVLAITDERQALITSISLLKRNTLAAPFERAFAIHKDLEAQPLREGEEDAKQQVMAIHYRYALSLLFQTLANILER